MRLGMHAIVGLEEGSGQCDQFAVAGVIETLDSGNALSQMRLRLPDVLGQFGFGACRSRNQYGPGVTQCRSNALEEFLVHSRMAAVARIRLVMNVLIRVFAANTRALHIRGVELKHPGFAVIDPDQRMVVVSHMARIVRVRLAAGAAIWRRRSNDGVCVA